MRAPWVALGLMAVGLAVAACEPCLDGGTNGLDEPGEGYYQLVFSNVTGRQTVLYVDGDWAGRICEQTEFASVGNFPVSPETTIEIRSPDFDASCFISPNCSTDCGGQVCDGSAVIDTTPFSGHTFATGFITRQE